MKLIAQLCGCSAIALGCYPSAVLAQSSPDAPVEATETAPAQTDATTQPQVAPSMETEQPADDGDPIVVTGTRIIRGGYEAPTPTTVVGEELLEQRAPATLIDALVTLPSLKNVTNQSTAGSSVAGPAGQSFINLRGLGANRTLVLLNGNRIVPSRETAAVDISIIPSGLVERVDVVTGGASAAWGSDAVAGVVNFILDTDYTGLKGEVQTGITSRKDGEHGKVELTYGTPLFDDRMHLLVSGEYYYTPGIAPNARSWSNPGGVIANPAFAPGNGQYRNLLLPHVYWVHPPEGLINSGPLRGTTFLPDGTPSVYQYCNAAGSTFQSCDDARLLPSSPYYAKVAVGLERGNIFGRLSYEVGPKFQIYGEVLYAESKSKYFSGPPSSLISGNFTIRNDNAFLPASIAAQLAQLGLTSFPLSRSFNDLGASPASRHVTTTRLVGGFDGEVMGDWKLRGSYEYGRSTNTFELSNNALIGRFRNSLDAVVDPATGRIVCRSTLSSPGNGCVPVNPFVSDPSVNPFSETASTNAANAYFMGTSLSELVLTQNAAEVSISGEPFQILAGPVSVAAGIAYRRETANQTADAESTAGLFALANPKPFGGKYDTKEVFAEAVVPLLKDLPFARLLELNAAGRYTDYSTSGGVSTWKVGVTYEPISGIRFRGTRSRDVRAPNLLELYASSVQSTFNVTDPANNQTTSGQAFSLGNPDLDVETGDTTAAGIVLQPAFLPGFSTSVDYYSIKLRGAIQTLSVQEIVNRCFAGSAALCPLITRDAGGAISSINSPYLNLSSINTNGLDVDISYRTNLGSVGLTLQALGSYVGKYEVSDGVNRRDQAGSVQDGQPKWTWNFLTSLSTGDLVVFLNAIHIGGGKYSSLYDGPFQLENNSVKSWTAFNASITYKLSSAIQAYLAADNITDKAPPFPFGSITGQGPGYDKIGRKFRIGARFSF